MNILVLLISLAGLPPLLGFVSKIIVIIRCTNSYSFIFILRFLILGTLDIGSLDQAETVQPFL